MFVLQTRAARTPAPAGPGPRAAGRGAPARRQVRPDALAGAGRASSGDRPGCSRRARVRPRPLRRARRSARLRGHFAALLAARRRRTRTRRLSALPLLRRRGAAAAAGRVERHGARPSAGAGRCLHQLLRGAGGARPPEAVAVRAAATSADLRRARRPRPTGWRAACAALGVGPEVRGGDLPSSARSELVVAVCSPSSRRAAPTCRSIPSYPARAAARRCWTTRGRRLGAADATARGCAPPAPAPAARRCASTAGGRWPRPRRRRAGGAAAAGARRRRDNLAYVIYTSGSTGRAQGGDDHARRHRRNRLRWHDRGTRPAAPARPGAADRPLSFDVSVWELFAPLLAGGRLRWLSRAIARRCGARGADRERLRRGITMLRCRRALLALLLGRCGGGRRGAPASLRRLVPSGEAAAARRCRRRWLAGLSARSAAQPLRPDRSTDDVDAAPRSPARRRRPPQRADRPAAAQLAPARARPRPAAGAARRRPASCTSAASGLARGYLGEPGPDRRALRARSVRRAAGRAPLSHRRPGALTVAGRHARVPRPRSTTR